MVTVPTDKDIWLTRDLEDGLLADIEIWLARPELQRFDDGDSMWIAPLQIVDRADTYWGTITVAEAIKEFGNGIPETYRECIYVARGRSGA